MPLRVLKYEQQQKKLLINMNVADSIPEQIREQNERGVLPGGIVLSL